jgi:hypothetical protein
MSAKAKDRLSVLLMLLLVPLASCGRESPPTQPMSGVLLESGPGSGGSVSLAVTKAGTGTGTITSSPSGISCGATCSRSFPSGTTVTLSAVPAAGSVFGGWSGAGCSGTGSCTVRLSANTTVTAAFNTSTTPPPPPPPGTFTLTVNKVQNSGTGSITSNPAGINCGTTCTASFPANTSVTLIATASTGQFLGWNGGLCTGSTILTCTVVLSSNLTITATFGTVQMVFLDSTLPDGNVGASYAVSINTNGGSGGQDQFSIVAGALPDGLQMSKFFGVQSTIITGRPTRIQTATFTVEARDESSSARRTFTITINAPVTLAITLPGPTARSGTVGTAYFQNLFASGGQTPYTWSITAGRLPPGLALLAASNGNRIQGTPTTRGTFTFTLTVRDKGGQQASQLTTITIN